MFEDWSLSLHLDSTYIQLRGDFNFLDLATRLILCLPASSGTMHLALHLNIRIFMWIFLFDPGTTCLHHLLPGTGTKWAHFT